MSLARQVALGLAVLVLVWPQEARVSGSSSAELVEESFRLTMETPSIAFRSEEDESRFHGEFRERSDADLEWLAGRIQAALDARDASAIELGRFDAALPEVLSWLDAAEEGSLERAPPGTIRLVISLRIDGEARFHVPAMTLVSLELALDNRPSREELRALQTEIEASLAAPEPDESTE